MQKIRSLVRKNYAGSYTLTSSYHSHLELRKSFFEYFKSKNHEILKSSSVIPDENEGSLLFTNAGMNQFKPLILSSTEPRRVANIQKCIRAGGKHNDLDDVGKDLHHQTFFEMMGNWSFNDAFSKEDACRFAWEYLVDILKIDADRLYVSYFGGFERLGLPEDRECREIWRRIGVPDDRILPFVDENFWEMGSTGPCGPCTEIHFDRIGGRDAARLVNFDDSVVEIWNIVFMSNLRDSSGVVRSLGKNHVDTGMGFERLLSVVQNKTSNFDTDVFTPILAKISDLTPNHLIYKGSVSSREDAIFRLVADHVRAATVAVSDGAVPDGSGSGFIIRKMMRRAFLQGNTRLGIERFALKDLIPTVVSTLENVYPEVSESSEAVQKLFQEEETQFWKTVDRAKKVFDSVATESKSPMISGKKAFKLFDTHGLPLSVTVELARNVGKEVDEKEFEKCQLEAQQLSKKASLFKIPISAEDFLTHTDSAKHCYSFKNEQYSFPRLDSKVLELYHEQKKVDVLETNEKGFVVLESCQFYAEQGGQASDTGHLMLDGEKVFHVETAKKVGGVTVLAGRAVQKIRKDSKVVQWLDKKRRSGLMRAHSATHLLNWALQRSGLGRGQKGSSVDVDRLRFDYSTGNESFEKEKRVKVLRECEEMINYVIWKGGKTTWKQTVLYEAKQMNLQSDVKEDRLNDASDVRIVYLGSGADVSVECCSGTHVLDVNHIDNLVILSDKAAAQGVRRIIAVTGNTAKECREYSKRIESDLQEEKDPNKRSAIGKKIDWKRLPLVDQTRIAAILKQKNQK